MAKSRSKKSARLGVGYKNPYSDPRPQPYQSIFFDPVEELETKFDPLNPRSKNSIPSTTGQVQQRVSLTPVPGQVVYRRPAPKAAKRYRLPSRSVFDKLQNSYLALRSLNPAQQIYCRVRKIRRELMFALKIAGKNRRRSPGRGGTYRRSYTSQFSCRG